MSGHNEFYLQKQALGWIWSVAHSLPTLALEKLSSILLILHAISLNKTKHPHTYKPTMP